MRKQVLVGLGLAGMAFAATAQSTVTVSGIEDVSIRHINNGSGGSVTQLGTDGLSNSQLVFSGREDLGAGMFSGFTLSAGFNPDDGSVNTTFFNRRSVVTLGGPFGKIRAGRDFNPSFWNVGLFDPFSNGVGNFQNIVSTLGSGVTTFLRTDNSVGYFLPSNLGGIYGQAMISASEGVVGHKYKGARLGYASGSVDVAVGWGATQGLADSNYKLVNAAASYNFGFMKLMGVVNKASYLARRQLSYLMGVSVPVGPGVIKVAYGSANMSGPGSTLANPYGDADDAKQVVLGYVHNLSKRTALYTSVSWLTQHGNSRRVVSPPYSPTGMQGGSSSRGYEFGIRHLF